MTVLPVPAVVAAAPRRWSGLDTLLTILAWVVILAMVTLIVLHQAALDAQARERARDRDSLGLVTIKMQGRYLVGAKALFGAQAGAGSADEARKLNTGTVDQRLRFLVLVGELGGARPALDEIVALKKLMAENDIEPTATQGELLDILTRLYRDYEKLRLDAPSVSAANREKLRTHLDWFGDLALAPAGLPTGLKQGVAVLAGGPAAVAVTQSQTPDPKARQEVLEPAKRTALTMVGMVALALLAFMAGFFLLVLGIIFWLVGTLRGGLSVGTHRGSIYAEAFALWLLIYFGPPLLLEWLGWEGGRLALVLAGDVLSFVVVLGWPWLRGVPWRHLRYEVGLTLGKRPLLEPAFGVLGYLATLPVLAAGAVVVLVLTLIQQFAEGRPDPENYFGPPTGPSHPIVELLAANNPWLWALVVLLAAVMAPLLEETVFRGILYRHLRELSGRFGSILSVGVSALVTSFLFAVIHPQGWIAVPVLMALALGINLIREWRGTLVPCMVAHAVHNGALVALGILTLMD